MDEVWRNFVHNFVHNFVRLKWQIVKLRSRSRLGKGQVRVRRVRRVRFGHRLYNIVKPWSKSESKPLSKQAPKSNKSPPKKGKKKDLDLGLTLK